MALALQASRQHPTLIGLTTAQHSILPILKLGELPACPIRRMILLFNPSPLRPISPFCAEICRHLRCLKVTHSWRIRAFLSLGRATWGKHSLQVQIARLVPMQSCFPIHGQMLHRGLAPTLGSGLRAHPSISRYQAGSKTPVPKVSVNPAGTHRPWSSSSKGNS